MKNHCIDKKILEISDEKYSGERPLFKSEFLKLNNCQFLQGESALKFANDIVANGCEFSSKYLFWHDKNLVINNSDFYDGARASIWYSDKININDSNINSPKIFRDSKNISIINTFLDTNETLWDCENIYITSCKIKGDYLLFHSQNIFLKDMELDGNYSFQHTKNLTAKNIKIKSKDAFWNSENVTIYDSIIEGEYLGWYSKNLRLVRCKIIGTQPLCYIQNLELVDCEMINTDLAFEYSILVATINSSIDSVKNPIKGTIQANEIKELILDDNIIQKDNLIIIDKSKKR